MLLSFVLVTHGVMDELLKSLESIEKQTVNNFEIIVVSDNIDDDDAFIKFLKNYFWSNKNIKLVLNSSIQGTAVSWNSGIDLAEGDYITFIKEGDEIIPTYVEEIQKVANIQEEGIDIIEYTMNLTNMANSSTITYVEKNRVYNLYQEFDPFAHINDLIYNKCFRTQFVHQYVFKFRRFVRYDMLFTFKAIGQAESYYYIDSEPLMSCQITPVNHSAFDLVNQWPHILNYYRRIGKYRELKDHLNYAYYKVMVHTWMWAVKRYGNKVLIKKAAAFAERKFSEKREDFMKNNKIFLEKKDAKFTEIVEGFDKYMKEIVKLSK